VDLIVGDSIIVRRLSGTWRLDLNGTLTKLGMIIGDSGFIAVGDSLCVTKVTAVWCMPLDGSGPQVKIAEPSLFPSFRKYLVDHRRPGYHANLVILGSPSREPSSPQNDRRPHGLARIFPPLSSTSKL